MPSRDKVKLYPDVDSKGAFELPQDLSDCITDIYELIDSISDPDNAELVLDDYYSGVLRTVEAILTTPIGQLHKKLEDLLEEVHVNMQVNYDAIMMEDDGTESVNTPQDKKESVPIERKIDLDNEDNDLSDEDMLRILPD